jgi:D-alanyl-D-alanine endopeptidase (penicillin-binding protein 7)
MPLRIPRRWGIWILAAVLAFPAMTAEAATKSSSSKVHRTGKVTRTKSKKRARRPRRPPPGGVYSRHAIVLDPTTGQVLYEKNAARSVPIASITKLMTAMVFLEQKPELDRVVEVTRDEMAGAGHTRLRRHEMVNLEDLLHMSLMCSDNVATRVLVRESGLESSEFLARMNQKATELELKDTRFVEFTGLDERNVSSAADVARMLAAASNVERIQEISTTQHYDFRSATAHRHMVVNTNRLLYNRGLEIVGGKTGFISESGYCLATWIRTQGKDLIAVVLGAPTNATRFADVMRLVNKTTRVSPETQSL